MKYLSETTEPIYSSLNNYDDLGSEKKWKDILKRNMYSFPFDIQTAEVTDFKKLESSQESYTWGMERMKVCANFFQE